MNPRQLEILEKLKEAIPIKGLNLQKEGDYNEILCKPKILPLKSISLLKIEKMEQDILLQAKQLKQN